MLSMIFKVLAHRNNRLRVDMSLHSDTLFWFWANPFTILWMESYHTPNSNHSISLLACCNNFILGMVFISSVMTISLDVLWNDNSCPLFCPWDFKRSPFGQRKVAYKTGDLLKEVQFIWNFLWHDRKKVTF
jgi:hypothetical protein